MTQDQSLKAFREQMNIPEISVLGKRSRDDEQDEMKALPESKQDSVKTRYSDSVTPTQETYPRRHEESPSSCLDNNLLTVEFSSLPTFPPKIPDTPKDSWGWFVDAE